MKSGTGARTNSRWAAMLKAGRAAGMSRHRVVQALRVASIPDADFEAAVESDNPPTMTALAEIGTRSDARLRAGHRSRRMLAALRAVEKLSESERRELIAFLNAAERDDAEWQAREVS